MRDKAVSSSLLSRKTDTPRPRGVSFHQCIISVAHCPIGGRDEQTALRGADAGYGLLAERTLYCGIRPDRLVIETQAGGIAPNLRVHIDHGFLEQQILDLGLRLENDIVDRCRRENRIYGTGSDPVELTVSQALRLRLSGTNHSQQGNAG